MAEVEDRRRYGDLDVGMVYEFRRSGRGSVLGGPSMKAVGRISYSETGGGGNRPHRLQQCLESPCWTENSALRFCAPDLSF